MLKNSLRVCFLVKSTLWHNSIDPELLGFSYFLAFQTVSRIASHEYFIFLPVYL